MRPGSEPAYAQMNRELAPYQGFPPSGPRPVGNPAADGLPTGHVPSPDAGGPDEVLQAHRRADDPRSVALSESTPATGGVLIPPTWAGRRRR